MVCLIEAQADEGRYIGLHLHPAQERFAPAVDIRDSQADRVGGSLDETEQAIPMAGQKKPPHIVLLDDESARCVWLRPRQEPREVAGRFEKLIIPGFAPEFRAEGVLECREGIRTANVQGRALYLARPFTPPRKD